MKRTFRIVAIALAVGASTAVFAQANNAGNGSNFHRNQEDVFSPGHANGGTFASGNTGNEMGFGRPQGRTFQGSVTPVPEPSQWAMMLAGLGLVAFIVRRSSGRS